MQSFEVVGKHEVWVFVALFVGYDLEIKMCNMCYITLFVTDSLL